MRMLRLLAALALSVGLFSTASAQLTTLSSLTLISNGTASGSQLTWPGGQGFYSVVGTFSGATVALQFVGPDGSTLISVGSSTNCTSACGVVFTLPRGKIQATVTAGPPSGIYATASPVPSLIG